MQLPIIHLNGSSRDSLVEQYTNAYLAVQDAIAVLQKLDVNGRDYYLINSDAASVAYREHRARIAKLVEVASDLEKIAEHCVDWPQTSERSRDHTIISA